MELYSHFGELIQKSDYVIYQLKTLILKKLLTTAALLAILFVSQITNSSCSKTVTDTVYIPFSSTVSGLLLGKQWIVDSLYQNYSASKPGTLVYARGGSGNTQNLDNYVVIFWPDNTQTFANGNSYIIYPFTYKSADSTNLLIKNPNDDYARIVKLTSNYLTIYDSTNSALSYYVYKP